MTLFFIHVTKTAGGTIKKMFRESGLEVQFHYPGENGFNADFDYPAETEVIYGHYRYGAHKLMQANANYACFVREPIARTISHFHHLKNVAQNAAGDRARQHGTIEAFLANTKNMDLDNLQTRMLSGVGRDVGFNKLDDTVLQLAIENMKKRFSYIGVFEELQASVDKLVEIFPSINGELPHVNKGKYETDLPQEVRSAVSERNQFDFRLYEEALKLVT